MSPHSRSDARLGRPEEKVRAVGDRVLSVLGRQSWLDRPGYHLEHALGFALAVCGGAGERTSNLLHGTWLGHPLHPLVVALPTGAVATTVVLDVAAVLPRHQSGLREASRVSLGVGIVASLAAAATGLNDWQHTKEQSRRVGLVHGALNAVATALYVQSWCDRRRGRHVRGVAGSAVGYAITAASGYLGASLVYRLGVGVDQSGARWDTVSGRRCWPRQLSRRAPPSGCRRQGWVWSCSGTATTSSPSESSARTWAHPWWTAGWTGGSSSAPGTVPASTRRQGRSSAGRPPLPCPATRPGSARGRSRYAPESRRPFGQRQE